MLPLLASGSQSMVRGPWRSPRPFEGIYRVKKDFIIVVYFCVCVCVCVFYCVDICTDGTKSVPFETAGTLAQIRAMTQNCTSSHIFHLHVFTFF